jgi:hypothetical protein
MSRLRATLIIGLATSAIVAPGVTHLYCDVCSASSVPNGFWTGAGLLAALSWALYWMETAPLRAVAINLTGTGLAVWTVWQVMPRWLG